MRSPRVSLVLFATLGMAACSEQHLAAPAEAGPAPDLAQTKAPPAPSDPTITWKFPLADAALGVRSDRRYDDGTYSVYANGVCNVTTRLQVATGDSLHNGNGYLYANEGNGAKACKRAVNLVYPDGQTEALPGYVNLHRLHSTTIYASMVIPIGATVKRNLAIVLGTPNRPSRCGALRFGQGTLGNGVGSDSVLVTRVNNRTFQVQSDGERNLAWCESTGELFAVPVSFVIVADQDLP